MTSDGVLAGLPRQLVNDQVLQQLLGQKNAEIAVADAGRAFFVAGLAEISSQTPIVVKQKPYVMILMFGWERNEFDIFPRGKRCHSNV